MTKKIKLLSLVTSMLLVLVLCGVTFGEATQVGYNPLRTAAATRAFPLTLGSSTAALDSIAKVDSSTWGTAGNPRDTLGNPRVAVLCEGNTTAATYTVKCGLYHWDGTSYTFLGEAPLATESGSAATSTATAGASTVTDGAGVYPANLIRFDTCGADVYDVRITALSAGRVSIKHWVYGYKSQ